MSNRTYHFNPADRTGLIMGMQGAQMAMLGASVLCMTGLFAAGIPFFLAVVPPIVMITICFTPFGALRLYEWFPIFFNWGKRASTGRLSWQSKLPAMSAGSSRVIEPLLPPVLDGIEILEVDAPWARKSGLGKVAVIKDTKMCLMTTVVLVRGREFALVDSGEQERLIDAWGEAIAPFCRERSPVTRISWTEWAAPSGVDDHRMYLDEACRAVAGSAPLESYMDLLEMAGPMVTTHEILVTLSVDWRKVRPSKRLKEDSVSVAMRQSVEEMRLLSSRLEGAHLNVSEPLTVAEIARTLRMRTDPTDTLHFNQRQRALTNNESVVSRYNLAPLSLQEKWRYVHVDNSFHRCYWVYEWPRLEVPGDWMSTMLLSTNGVRTIAMHYEPVPMSRSQRAVDRESTKLAADMQTREKHGFRVGANYGRAQKAVLDREQEIVAGYTEFEYSALVIVTASTEDELEERSAEYEQNVASVGVDIRPLDGRHAEAWVCGLPLGRGLAGRMIQW